MTFFKHGFIFVFHIKCISVFLSYNFKSIEFGVGSHYRRYWWERDRQDIHNFFFIHALFFKFSITYFKDDSGR